MGRRKSPPTLSHRAGRGAEGEAAAEGCSARQWRDERTSHAITGDPGGGNNVQAFFKRTISGGRHSDRLLLRVAASAGRGAAEGVSARFLVEPGRMGDN